jgi:hypothetical protein
MPSISWPSNGLFQVLSELHYSGCKRIQNFQSVISEKSVKLFKKKYIKAYPRVFLKSTLYIII